MADPNDALKIEQYTAAEDRYAADMKVYGAAMADRRGKLHGVAQNLPPDLVREFLATVREHDADLFRAYNFQGKEAASASMLAERLAKGTPEQAAILTKFVYQHPEAAALGAARVVPEPPRAPEMHMPLDPGVLASEKMFHSAGELAAVNVLPVSTLAKLGFDHVVYPLAAGFDTITGKGTYHDNLALYKWDAYQSRAAQEQIVAEKAGSPEVWAGTALGIGLTFGRSALTLAKGATAIVKAGTEETVAKSLVTNAANDVAGKVAVDAAQAGKVFIPSPTDAVNFLAEKARPIIDAAKPYVNQMIKDITYPFSRQAGGDGLATVAVGARAANGADNVAAGTDAFATPKGGFVAKSNASGSGAPGGGSASRPMSDVQARIQAAKEAMQEPEFNDPKSKIWTDADRDRTRAIARGYDEASVEASVSAKHGSTTVASVVPIKNSWSIPTKIAVGGGSAIIAGIAYFTLNSGPGTLGGRIAYVPQEFAKVGVDFRAGVTPNFGASGATTATNDDFSPDKLKIPDVLQEARHVDGKYGNILKSAGIGYGSNLTSLIEADKNGTLTQTLSDLKLQGKLNDAEIGEIQKSARDLNTTAGDVPRPEQKPLFDAAKKIFPDIGKYYFNQASADSLGTGPKTFAEMKASDAFAANEGVPKLAKNNLAIKPVPLTI